VEQRRAFSLVQGRTQGRFEKMPVPAGDEFNPVETQWSSFPASSACAAREGKPGAEAGTGVCGTGWVPFPSLSLGRE
jgi:hypothetical protein